MDKPFDYQVLYQQILVYLTFQSADLYRMKGLIWIANDDNQYVIQSVGKRLDISKRRYWELDEEKGSVIVFIGKNLQRLGFERLLNKCLTTNKIHSETRSI